MRKKIVLLILGILVVIQFIRPARNSGNADTVQDISHVTQLTPEIKALLKTSCYDCHSNHTNYPWYATINPVGWWLGNHIKEGKEELNFSEFASYTAKRQDHKLEEIAEEVKEGHMPLPSYTWIHTYARLNPDQAKQLIDWANAQRKPMGNPE